MKHERSHASDGVARLILSYLALNPQAADSAEGIRRWWLGPSGSRTTQAGVEQALAQLVDDGLMRRVSLADGTLLYSREPNSATTAP